MGIIQIKRGTGSAVPSGLADGELAINLDNNKFYFGTGSAVKNDFHFNNITASNDISSSGTITANRYDIKDQQLVVEGFNSLTVGNSNRGLILHGSTLSLGSGDVPVFAEGNITASGHISASGNSHTFGRTTISDSGLVVGSPSGVSIKVFSEHAGTNRDVGLHMSASSNGQEYSIGLNRVKNSFYIAPSDVNNGPENAVFETDAIGNITASSNISATEIVTGKQTIQCR